MTNECVYIAKLKGKLISLYYDKKGGIYQRRYVGGGFTEPEQIATNVTENFSISISRNDEIFMFCNNNDGDIILYNYSGEKWTNRIIQKNLEKKSYNIRFHAVIDKSDIHLLYNVPGDENFNIVSQKMADGVWGKSVTVAENVLNCNHVFTVQNIVEGHYIVYFQTGGRGNNFCGKEFYLPDNWGTLKVLNPSPYPYIDKSVVTAKDGIHGVFILRGLYSSRIIYRNWLGDNISSSVVLSESARLHKAAICIHRNTIHIIFQSQPSGFFATRSLDGGKTFTRPTRMNAEGDYAKAEYVSGGEQYQDNMIIHDIFIDTNNAGTILLPDDIAHDFYNGINTNVSAPSKEASDAYIEQQAESSQRIAILENKLSEAYKDLADKNRQILDINSLMIKKNDEVAQINNNWREVVGKLQQEVSARKESEKTYVAEIERLKKELEQLANNTVKPAAAEKPKKTQRTRKPKKAETDNIAAEASSVQQHTESPETDKPDKSITDSNDNSKEGKDDNNNKTTTSTQHTEIIE